MGRRRGGTNYYGKCASIAAGLLLAGGVGSAQAQLTTGLEINGSTAHVVEWDLGVLPDQLDVNPGAITVDTRGEDHNQLWFVTRAGAQRVYRFNPPESLLKGDAQFTSWSLRPDPMLAGGIKRVRPSHDRRFVFARTPVTIQRIDSQSCTPGVTAGSSTCPRVVWTMEGDDPLLVSDVAADDANHIFTTGVSQADARFATGYVQMLDPAAAQKTTLDTGGNLVTTTLVKRWADDFGAGICTSNVGISTVCNAGIDVRPNKQNLIYFVEVGADGHGFIVELNVSNSTPSTTNPNVRRWSLAKLGALTNDPAIAQPRMLKIDRSGRIWVNTGSGHLVSLDPNTNRMTKHQIPGVATNGDSASNDPWGVAPDDDVIGYTAANLNKVAMMFPKRAPVTVPPAAGFLPVVDFTVVVSKETSDVVKTSVPGTPKIVATRTTANTDGIFVEGFIDTGTAADGSTSTPSMQPLGITANRAKAQGSFFYTVGLSGTDDPLQPNPAKRIGFIRLPMKDKAKFARDDDDPDDGFDRTREPRWHNAEPDDDDADGVPNEYDTNTTRDNMTVSDPAIVAVGQSWDYPMSTSPTTLALIAAVTPDVATATIAVDVYNAIGTLVGTSGPIIGAAVATVPTPAAGTYTIRVRNLGTAAVTPTSTTVVREPGIPQ